MMAFLIFIAIALTAAAVKADNPAPPIAPVVLDGTSETAPAPGTTKVSVRKVIEERPLTEEEKKFIASVPNTGACGGLRNACRQMLLAGIIHIPRGGVYIAGTSANYWRMYQVWTARLEVEIPAVAGPQGPAGPPGAPGARGPRGPAGPPGASPDLTGLVRALEALEQALKTHPRGGYLPRMAPGVVIAGSASRTIFLNRRSGWEKVGAVIGALSPLGAAYIGGRYFVRGMGARRPDLTQVNQVGATATATGGAGGQGGVGGTVDVNNINQNTNQNLIPIAIATGSGNATATGAQAGAQNTQ